MLRGRAWLLGADELAPEGTVVEDGEVGLGGGCRRDQGLEVELKGIEGLPERRGSRIRRAEFGEAGPVVLHGRGELLLLLSERRVREGEEVLKLGSVGGAVGECHRREEILRRTLVVELVGGERNELRHGEVGGKSRTGEDDVGASGSVSQVG